MRVALYARTSAADRETVEQILANLSAHADRRGWEVALECADQVLRPEGSRKGLRSLLEALQTGAVQAVLVRTLSHLARSLRHLTDLGHLLAAQDVALIAIEDASTPPTRAERSAGATGWKSPSAWTEPSAPSREARPPARARRPLGRPAVAVNPLELLTCGKAVEAAIRSPCESSPASSASRKPPSQAPESPPGSRSGR